MARVEAQKLQSALGGKSERGAFGGQLHHLIYLAADDGTLRFTVDTIDLGAGSIAFTLDNRNLPQAGEIKVYIHNGEAADANDVANMTEVAFKDEAGTETVAGGLAVAGDKVNVIITYASYPEVMANRFFVFEYTPDAAMGVDVTIPVYVSVK